MPDPEARIRELEAEVARLRETLATGEKFLNACTSAWACGEPEHRVRTMLIGAEEFRLALARLALQQEAPDAI